MFKLFKSVPQKDKDKQLFLAIGNHDVARCIELIRQGADIHAKDKNGGSPLHSAVWEDHAEILRILLKAGADPSRQDNLGKTPLHTAAIHGHLAAIELLCEAGADLQACDGNHWTPLHYAVHMKQFEVCERLLALGADENAQDSEGKTPADLINKRYITGDYKTERTRVRAIFERSQLARLEHQETTDDSDGARLFL